MSIVLISRGSYSRGKELAEMVAQALGYECISREVVMSAAKVFGVKELKLVKAMRDAPSFWGMFPGTRQKYIAYVQAALIRYLEKDDIVYHGLAGHLLVPGVSHVLKVRIISTLEDRVRLVMENEHFDEREARKFILKADEQRRKWTKLVYGADNTDPDLYDLVINVAQIDIEKAAGIVIDAEQFMDTGTATVAGVVTGGAALRAPATNAVIPLATVLAQSTHEALGEYAEHGGCQQEGFDTHVHQPGDGGNRVVGM